MSELFRKGAPETPRERLLSRIRLSVAVGSLLVASVGAIVTSDDGNTTEHHTNVPSSPSGPIETTPTPTIEPTFSDDSGLLDERDERGPMPDN